MKFRIGAKLAISAGIGILFVAGMVLNQQMADSADESTRIVSDRAQKVFNAVKDSEVAFQRPGRLLRPEAGARCRLGAIAVGREPSFAT